MKNRPAKALVAVLSGAGAAVGVGAAVVWHVAVPASSGETQIASAYDRSGGYGWYGEIGVGVSNFRPDWFPVSLYFVGAGLLVGLILASFLVDAGLRMRVDRHRPRLGLFALLVGLGIALGSGVAAAWTHWPPEQVAVADSWTNFPAYWERPATAPYASGSETRLEPQTIVIESNGSVPDHTEGFVATAAQSSFSPQINHPWLVFPLGGALITGTLALSLSLRDIRLTGRND